jgi:hypothetical protein
MSGQDKRGIGHFRNSYAELTTWARRARSALNLGRLARPAARVALCPAGALLLAVLVMAAPAPSSAQVAVGISVTIAPPALPVYVQPICPGPGFIWIPGYWAWDPEFGYYWVPGTWVIAPYQGLLWTPGYWGWYNGAYVWYEGYWGPVVGFYGGINYGFGYNGHGYYGGYWDHGTFYYNRTVNNIRTTNITNFYSKRIPSGPTRTRVSYNGGRGGISLRPTNTQLAAGRQKSSAPIAAQNEHLQAARRDPGLRASANRGRPAVAATPKPGEFRGPGVVRASRAGTPYTAPPPSRPAPAGARERSTMPAGQERRPGTAPGREAPPAPGMHPAAPRGEPERPAVRHEELRREQPMPHVVRPPAEPRPAPQPPHMAPAPGAPPAGPREMAPRPPHGGEKHEEGPPRP